MLTVLPWTDWGLPTLVARIVFVVGIVVALICIFLIIRNESRLRGEKRVSVEIRPTEQGDWAHLVVKNTSNKTVCFSARVHGITYDEKDAFRKGWETPYAASGHRPECRRPRLLRGALGN